METKYFIRLKIAQAFIFLLIPFFLYIANEFHLEKSISAFVNKTPKVFALSLILAGALFFYDGFIERGRWSNMYVGASLFFIYIFDFNTNFVLHYIFATIFFIGSLFNMVYFSSKKERIIKLITAILVLFGMAGCFLFEWYSIFWAEWIAMFPISIHFILENLEKID
jgi:hypothetical membrane protein